MGTSNTYSTAHVFYIAFFFFYSTHSNPLVVSNQCDDTIWPGILTQSGEGPGTGGFELASGSIRTMTVSDNWQGRVWGRTNCSFGGNGRSCMTGDCGNTLSCQGTGEVPTTLAEFTLDPGSGQTFYDLSLVDGYNLPVAIQMLTSGNSSFAAIPPNLTNPSCIATVSELAPSSFDPYSSGQSFLGTNYSSPLPFDTLVTSSQVSSWCPWDLQVSAQTGPSSGIYTYPDGNIQRPAFDPCYSACAKYGQAQYCCTGSYNSPSSCTPSDYSQAAKKMCPDAYSYAFDDQTSTFIIPAGTGFEVVFCPGGRSTNIIGSSKKELTLLSQEGHVRRRNEDELPVMHHRLPVHEVWRRFVEAGEQNLPVATNRGHGNLGKPTLAVVVGLLLVCVIFP